MRSYTVLLLISLFWFYSIVETRNFFWKGTTQPYSWNSYNWDCTDCGNGNFIPTATDDVTISEERAIRSKNVDVREFSQCRSLKLIGKVNISIFEFLEVGSGGIVSSNLSTLFLTNNLSSQGDVYVNGNCIWKSGAVYGPGTYNFESIQASVCNVYAHIYATSVTVQPYPDTSIIDIQIFPNAWLMIKEMTFSYPLTILGNITVNSLEIGTQKRSLVGAPMSTNLTLLGEVTQNFRYMLVRIPCEIRIYTPVFIDYIDLFNDVDMLIYSSNATIIRAEGLGNIVIFPGANLHYHVVGTVVPITTFGTLYLYKNQNLNLNDPDILVVNVSSGGFLYTFGNVFVDKLCVSMGTLVGDVTVNMFMLGSGLSTVFDNVDVLKSANVTGTHNYAGKLSISNTAIAQFENCQFSGTGTISNRGVCNINEFSSYTGIVGDGTWNVMGTWVVRGSCNITGTINIKGGSVLKIDNINQDYIFNSIIGGSIIGSGTGSFVAKDVDVDSFYDHFGSVQIDCLSSTNYTSVCCAFKDTQKIIKNLRKVDSLIFTNGSYSYKIQSVTSNISYLQLSDEVELQISIADPYTIINFDFYGGTLDSLNRDLIEATQTNMIGNSLKKYTYGLSTETLDWSKCDDTCGVTKWSAIVAATCVCSKCDSCVPCSNFINCIDCSDCGACQCTTGKLPCGCNNF